MNKKRAITNNRKTQLAALLATLFMPSILYAAAVGDFSPYPSAPLNLHPKAAARVQPNVLVMLDNSYDGSRTADKDNKVPLPPFNRGTTKIQIAKQVMGEVAEQYPQYRWGVAAYSPYTADVNQYINQIPMCYESGFWRNMHNTTCTFSSQFGVLANSANIAMIPYFHDVGGQLYVPIKDRRTASEFNDFRAQLDTVPEWGAGSAAHSSPLTSAYYEMTRYFRGMRSAYQRAGDNYIHLIKQLQTIPTGAYRSSEPAQYISPIQYRCQSNNIIVITSAADIRTSNAQTLKRGYYEAYHTDPLFKHDNPEYAYLLSDGSDSKGYAAVKNPSIYSKLIMNDFVNWLPATVPPDVGKPLYNRSRGAIEYYNNQFNPKEQGSTIFGRLSPGSKYIRQLNDGSDEQGRSIRDMRDIDGDFAGGNYNSNKLTYYTSNLSANAVLNPYMDIIEDVGAGSITSQRIRPYNNNVKFDPVYGVRNVITRNAYNERVGIDAFAHLAHDGDVVAKAGSYQYPHINYPGGSFSNDEAWISHVSSPIYNGCASGQKCLFNTDGAVAKAVDKENKAWDGSDDIPLTSVTGSLVDYATKFGKQNINTYGIGFGLYSPKLSDFKQYTIQKFGVRDLISKTQTVFIDYNSSIDLKPEIGDVVFYKNRMLVNQAGDPVKLTTTALSEGSGRYVWTHAFPVKVCLIKGATVAYGLDDGHKNTAMGDEPCQNIVGEDGSNSVVDSLKYDDVRDFPAGQQFQIIPGDLAQQFVDPQPKADQLLKWAAQKGGGAYLSVNTDNAGDPAGDLKTALIQILNMIDASLVALPVGSTVASNDVGKITSAITNTLDSDRWSSELRFYRLNDKGEFDAHQYSTPDYNVKAVTVLNTPKGLRRLAVNGFEDQVLPATSITEKSAVVADTHDGVTLNNRTFNIGPDDISGVTGVDHGSQGSLKVAVSTRPYEWKNLVAWLLRATPNDRHEAFKTTVFGVDKLIYRDRDPNQSSEEGKRYPREMGDVMDSNILLMSKKSGFDYQAETVRPYLAVGANDGMVHVLRANGNTVQPYEPAFNYIPGAARRGSKDEDTIMRSLVYTAEQSYGTQTNQHKYFINGQSFYLQTNAGDVRPNVTNTNGQLMMVGSLGQGGRAVYALNIGGTEYGSTVETTNVNDPQMIGGGVAVGLDTPRDDWHTKVPLWDSSRVWDRAQLRAVVNGIEVRSKTCEASGFSDDQKAQCLFDRDIGYTIGSPQLARVKENMASTRYGVYLSSGFDSGSHAAVPTLYVLDQLGRNVITHNAPQDQSPGRLIRAIPVCDAPTPVYETVGAGGSEYGPPGTQYMSRAINSADCIAAGVQLGSGLAAPQAVDLDGDLVMDLVYAGDQNGNMWRFDLRHGSANWGAKMIYRGSLSKPITSAPAIYHQYGEDELIVAFGTGSELYSKDLTNKDVQTMYGIFDYVDSCPVASNLNICQAATGADLLRQHISAQKQGQIVEGRNKNSPQDVMYRKVSVRAFPETEVRRGWSLDLVYDGHQEGERVVYQPAIIQNNRGKAAVVFTSHIFDNGDANTQQSCTPPLVDVKNWIMAVDVKTGTNVREINLDRTVNGEQISGFMVYGRTSPLLFANIDNLSITPSGAAVSGVEPALGAKLPADSCGQSGYLEGVYATQTGTGGSIGTVGVNCRNRMVGARRLAWREVF